MNKTQSSHWTLTIMVRSQKTWSSKEKFTMIQNLNSEKSWLKNHCRMSIAHSLRFLHKMPPSPPICGSFMRNAPNSQMRNHRRPKMGFSFLFRPALEWMEGSTRVQCLHQAPAWRVHQHHQHQGAVSAPGSSMKSTPAPAAPLQEEGVASHHPDTKHWAPRSAQGELD